jgi:hypothetical protein
MKTPQETREKSVRSVAGRLRDRLDRSAADAVLGREAELARILRHFDTDGAVLGFVYGSGGIGKSSVLAALVPRLVNLGARVVRLDGRTVEPTPRGLFAAMAGALGAPAPFNDVEAMARALDSEPRATVIVVDEYDRIRLLDAWLRHELLPAQPERTRWLFAGRFAPRSAWLEHPEIREAFFPSHEGTLAIDAALPGDREAVLAIAKRYESVENVAVLERWWQHGRAFFDVARDVAGNVLGFAILAESSAIPRAIVEHDPLVRAWLTDLEAGPGRDRGALFHRRVLSADHGEEPCDARGALWLAAKRAYVARPGQWALYAGTRQQAKTLRLVQKFGFRNAGIQAGDDATLLLEFGAAGIWSWLRGLVREAVEPVLPGWRVVESSRGLLVDGASLALSPLEYGVLVELVAARGAVVTRDALLDRVWKQRHTGSNVVDALVRLLRKKLASHASDIETVKGHGFRITRHD